MKSESNSIGQNPLKRKTPISYYGGKQSMLKNILPLIPKHIHYVEPFFGGGAVFWAKEPSRIEIINDYNDNVVNFYRVMKMRFEELQKIVQSTPFSREIYKNALLIYNTPQAFDPLKRAWAFWVVTNQGFSNQIGSWRSSGLNNKEVVKNTNKREQFTTELAKRLDHVQIECKDAVELIKSKDSKDTFFYIDPPYVGSNQGHYGGYTQEHFNELLTTLKSIKGKFLLSSYPNAPLLKFSKSAKWHSLNLKMALNASNTKGKTKTEVLTANFPITKPTVKSNSLNGVSPLKNKVMITTTNYFEEFKKLDYKKLPMSLKKEHFFIVKQTNKGASWKNYKNSAEVKMKIDNYLRELNLYVIQSKVTSKTSKSTSSSSVELKFIERYCLLHNKTVSSAELNKMLLDLQSAISQKKIRATSNYASTINAIQNSFIGILYKLKSSESIQIELVPEIRNYYLSLIGKQHLLDSVDFINRYIDFHDTNVKTKDLKKLLDEIQSSIRTKKITSSDPNFTHLSLIVVRLQEFIKTHPIDGRLSLKPQELNGLRRCKGVKQKKVNSPKLKSKKNCTKKGLNGINESGAMNSMDVLPLRFNSLGFHGIWLEFLGNPAKGFTAMVSGRPKLGKSTLCLNFAGYLAKHHGRVLYVAREEKIGDTFQKKLIDAQVAHPNLDVIEFLPSDLSKYDFLFLDSVTKLGLTPEQLEQLKNKYPQLSIIGIYQVTKDGVFRGNNSYQHDVDIVIEIPEQGLAKQFGRYNPGSEMRFFNHSNNQSNDN